MALILLKLRYNEGICAFAISGEGTRSAFKHHTEVSALALLATTLRASAAASFGRF